SGVDPRYLMLEITESAAMTNVAPALENLARLCMNGFSLSIDDYGTGSSNLQQLTRIAFSELKIDQSFVKDFADNKSLRIVVKSSIDMAHKLNVKSVAEGVETSQDWEALKAAGCDTAQGYFIAKPMDRNGFAEFIGRYRPGSFTAEESGIRPPQKQIRILVVDDDNFARKIILRVLGDLGYSNVSDAASAESAIRAFESEIFDLVVTDVNMPGMNGLKFVQMIRSGKTHARPGTRIMVLTLFSQTEVLGTALALDVNGFLVKPIVPSVIEEKLGRAMSEQLRLRSPIAYETVRTEPKALDKMSPKGLTGAAVAIEENRSNGVQFRGRSLAPHRLRPGMVLAEGVHLRDGTLILSGGHALSEMSINRLNDLEPLLPSGGIMVQE
ncbi:MAG TPA: EAL domain-containing protein, partial [Burkholderiales bacterium]|nr:EAL domain-containing protein [Burkholderiales bacterium]